MQLIEIQDQFPAMGINIAAMTYDPFEFLKEVELDEGVEFPLLQDIDRKHVTAFGILNTTDYEPGNRAWGVPYPGIFLIDPDGVIRYKFAEESYRVRPDFADVLEAAANL
ncbi:MAG: redoxin domain-containing protein [Pseudomonadales bacterium]|nr:redoxin domain-containing protein [Pseudomonadales bacterium]MCP5347564.1 redoxin domain-containing protein [Pseudomonadales bacterium]